MIDFDAVLRDGAHPSRMAARFDSGDRLHPGDEGNRAMADAVDLNAKLPGLLPALAVNRQELVFRFEPGHRSDGSDAAVRPALDRSCCRPPLISERRHGALP